MLRSAVGKKFVDYSQRSFLQRINQFVQSQEIKPPSEKPVLCLNIEFAKLNFDDFIVAMLYRIALRKKLGFSEGYCLAFLLLVWVNWHAGEDRVFLKNYKLLILNPTKYDIAFKALLVEFELIQYGEYYLSGSWSNVDSSAMILKKLKKLNVEDLYRAELKLFTKQEFLQQVVLLPYDDPILLVSYSLTSTKAGHVVGILRRGDVFFFVDANSPSCELIPFSLKEIEHIFRALLISYYSWLQCPVPKKLPTKIEIQMNVFHQTPKVASRLLAREKKLESPGRCKQSIFSHAAASVLIQSHPIRPGVKCLR